MRVFRYIFFKAMRSFFGVFLILCAIDFSFNFFSEMEDVSEAYTYQHLIIYLLKTEPYRMREFVYLCFVVGFLALFIDKNFIRAFNTARQAGLNKIIISALVFAPIVLTNLLAYEYFVPEMTRQAESERKELLSSKNSEEQVMIEIIKQKKNQFRMVSEDISITFNDEGLLDVKDEFSNSFNNLNYNSNLKFLSFSDLSTNAKSKFVNFNLVVKTEFLRRATSYLSYFVIFLIGLEMLLSFNRKMNINRILIYSFGVCLVYNFIESLIADSISVFGLSFYFQGFPILLIILYFAIRKRLFF
tara:strand:+ start:340 stop:1242 length:903 start_codon:yes stop_codon:yes gene_type:complete